MKVRNINFSFLILASLVIMSFGFYAAAENSSQGAKNIFQDSDQDGLSDQEEKLYGTDPAKSDTDGDGYSDGAEVKSGYDPLKPAPGDKITYGTASLSQNSAAGAEAERPNLTKAVASKIVEISNSTDAEDQNMTIEELKSMVEESMTASGKISDDALPQVDPKDLKIKKQNYSGLSDEKAAEKKKSDFIKYITAVIYVISSNSPKPITSVSDLGTVSTYVTEKIVTALTNRDSSALEDLNKSGDKMFSQLKEIEVPEEISDTHIKALRFALYAKNLESVVPANNEDPLGDIANFGKVEAFISVVSQFADTVQADFKKYGVDYNDQEFMDKLKDLGLDISSDDIESATSALDTASSAAGIINLDNLSQ
ncbi:MAG: hypothetical protein HGB08_04900 [Candidatus Moranbacteria bacterium]|nr:hypothetical protein [Candidatus Moranbacteria bacterium]